MPKRIFNAGFAKAICVSENKKTEVGKYERKQKHPLQRNKLQAPLRQLELLLAFEHSGRHSREEPDGIQMYRLRVLLAQTRLLLKQTGS